MTASGARISIAMTTYNSERFVAEQLESFVRQERLPDELVVSDDASVDSTVEVVRGFAARAPFPVRLFVNQQHLGLTKNFERAIAESTGDIIFLSDADDSWYPHKILVMERALEGTPEGRACCLQRRFGGRATRTARRHSVGGHRPFLPQPQAAKSDR